MRLLGEGQLGLAQAEPSLWEKEFLCEKADEARSISNQERPSTRLLRINHSCPSPHILRQLAQSLHYRFTRDTSIELWKVRKVAGG